MSPRAATGTVALRHTEEVVFPMKQDSLRKTSHHEGAQFAKSDAFEDSHSANNVENNGKSETIQVSADYVNKLESRLAALEERLNSHDKTLEGDATDDASDTESEQSKPKKTSTKDSEKKESDKDAPAVVKDGLFQKPEVLRLAPDEWRTGKKAPWESDCALVVATEGYTEPNEEKGEPGSFGRPLRLLVNSQALRKILTQITGANFASERNVLTRPFRYLLTYDQEIRNRLKKLQQEAESETQFDASATENPADAFDGNKKAGPSGDPADKTTRLAAQMSCLVDFMDNDMKDIFDVREQIRQRTVGEIHFEDLWMLFKPGDMVVSGNGSDDNPRQAYRVLYVTGGRRILDVTNRSRFEPPPDKWRYYYRTDWTPEDDGEEMLYNQTRNSSLAIDCFYLDSDGRRLGAKPKRFVIGEFNGKLPIPSLEVVPLDFLPEAQSIRNELIARGQLYETLMKKRRARYQGVTVRDPYTGCNEKDQINSEVVLDQASAIDHYSKVLYPLWTFGFDQGVIRNHTEPDKREVFEPKDCEHSMCSVCTDIMDDTVLDAERRMQWVHSTELLRYIPVSASCKLGVDWLILLPAKVYGYALLHRKWYPLAVVHIEIGYKTEPSTRFADLVLPDGHEKIIRALVKNQIKKHNTELEVEDIHSSRPRSKQSGISMDVVRGKGQGLTILLHGVPGVGKTSTAECVAAELKRPLFPVTCGDLGNELSGSQSVEVKLNSYFMLAHKWECVLLLDEADVFLAKREKGGDLTRNALVSIFLRVLEYYPGVLILTTNRVGEFDEAFKSRIHISLHYPKLKEDSTARIWETHIRRLKENDLGVDIDEVAVRKFYKKFWADNVRDKKPSRQWNGRQIKNAFQTAIALANWDFYDEADGKKLDRPLVQARHFKLVQETGAQFDDYISKVYHVDKNQDVHAVIAQREELRNDENSSDSSESSDGRRRHRRARGSKSKKEGRHRRQAKDTVSDEESEEDDPETRIAKIKLELVKLKKKKNPSDEEELRGIKLRRELAQLEKASGAPGKSRRARSEEDIDEDDEDEDDRWGR